MQGPDAAFLPSTRWGRRSNKAAAFSSPEPLPAPPPPPPGPPPSQSAPVPSGPARKRAEGAYVFLVYGQKCEKYLFGALLACWSLLVNLCTKARVLLVTPDVPESLVELAKSTLLFTEVLVVDYVEAREVCFDNPAAHARFRHVFTKYRVLELEHYDKVLLLDADVHVRANLDELFDLKPPAAMARGPEKPPHGALLAAGCAVNAGVMLLKPSKAFLQQILKELASPELRMRKYNSPDADYLTDHQSLKGSWSSIGLEFNYQLEFETVREGMVRFSSKREEHFSEKGANLPWEQLKLLHFSGHKPWSQLLQDCSAQKRLSAEEGCSPALTEKLVRGLAEYATAAAECQALCCKLDLGRSVLWREHREDQATFPFGAEGTKAQLAGLLPQGTWSAVKKGFLWTPLGNPSQQGKANGNAGDVCGAVLRLEEVEAAAEVGERVRMRRDGREFRVMELLDSGKKVLLRRRLELSPEWKSTRTAKGWLYYYTDSGKTQWEWPEKLPSGWRSELDSNQGGRYYYYHKESGQTRWDPPEFEELECAVEELEPGPEGQKCEATLWRRSFGSDAKVLAQVSQALSEARGGLHDV